jgi:hypothetical protein
MVVQDQVEKMQATVHQTYHRDALSKSVRQDQPGLPAAIH